MVEHLSILQPQVRPFSDCHIIFGSDVCPPPSAPAPDGRRSGGGESPIGGLLIPIHVTSVAGGLMHCWDARITGKAKRAHGARLACSLPVAGDCWQLISPVASLLHVKVLRCLDTSGFPLERHPVRICEWGGCVGTLGRTISPQSGLETEKKRSAAV